ncbi:MAG: hypothetical protein RBR73_00470 [Halothiobacillaceae bacterium]|jgi:hypothetical protein|nr:hypothetical protein [Halothiobacillaceae bacterium]
MYEFTFLHPGGERPFVEHLEVRGLPCDCRPDPVAEGTVIVRIAQELEDELYEELEAMYDRLMDDAQPWLDEAGHDMRFAAAGITVHLADGRTSLARVAPEMLNRLLSVLSPQELGEFVARIADAVENPDDSPLCKARPE